MIIDILYFYAAIGLAWGFVRTVEIIRFIAYGIVPYHVTGDRRALILEYRGGLRKAIKEDGFPKWMVAIIIVWFVVTRAGKDAIIWPVSAYYFIKGE